MKKTKRIAALLLYLMLLSGDAAQAAMENAKEFTFTVKPETFEINVCAAGAAELVSEPQAARRVTSYRETPDGASWEYPDEKLKVEICKETRSLAVTIRATGTTECAWPDVSGERYVLPVGEGKVVPAGDADWQKFLTAEPFELNEWFAMRFFAVEKERYAIVYVLEDLFNSTANFSVAPAGIRLTLRHEFHRLNATQPYRFRIYLTAKDPTRAAMIYKQLVSESGKLQTLEGKASANPAVRKLYGAPHIYLWSESPQLIESFQQAGIRQAWLGLPDWRMAERQPDVVLRANTAGYLIAPYDSYHSIHPAANVRWSTAAFPDRNLYDDGCIVKRNGQPRQGFLGAGRLLNPTLSLPSVNRRVAEVVAKNPAFNSWFIDCDATGASYDDFSAAHPTAQRTDASARLERMALIRDRYGMVIGSEQGNDFAATTISFAHGLETPVIQWADDDMRKNRDSEYYVGEYWAADGQIPGRYGKTVPIKPLYRKIYLDPAYSIPLFKLVYNDCVITTHHWEWASFKIARESKLRMLKEILYNVPPLYHLNAQSWQANREKILAHLAVWAPFHRKAIVRPMTGFTWLSADRLVQRSEFGEMLAVVANFSATDFNYEHDIIKAGSLVIYDGESKVEYTPTDN